MDILAKENCTIKNQFTCLPSLLDVATRMFAVWMTGILFTLESAALMASFEAKFFPSSSLDNWLQSYRLILPVSSQGPWSSFKEPGQGYWVLTECPPCVHVSHLKQICEEFHPAVSCWLVAEEGGHQWLKRNTMWCCCCKGGTLVVLFWWAAFPWCVHPSWIMSAGQW